MTIRGETLGEIFEAQTERDFFPTFDDDTASVAFESALTIVAFEGEELEMYADAREYVFKIMIGDNTVTESNIGNLLRELDTLVGAWRVVYHAIFHPESFDPVPDSFFRSRFFAPVLNSSAELAISEEARQSTIETWIEQMYTERHPFYGNLMFDVIKPLGIRLPKREHPGNWLIGAAVVPYW